jgi:hypothetical protein
VSALVILSGDKELTGIVDSSIYQDVPLNSLEEFMQLAPEEARRPDEEEHQLMLNRLSFELAERQRYEWSSFSPQLSHDVPSLGLTERDTISLSKKTTF